MEEEEEEEVEDEVGRVWTCTKSGKTAPLRRNERAYRGSMDGPQPEKIGITRSAEHGALQTGQVGASGRTMNHCEEDQQGARGRGDLYAPRAGVPSRRGARNTRRLGPEPSPGCDSRARGVSCPSLPPPNPNAPDIASKPVQPALLLPLCSTLVPLPGLVSLGPTPPLLPIRSRVKRLPCRRRWSRKKRRWRRCPADQ